MRDLAIRALAHLDAGTTDQCSEIMRLPIKAYTDPETFKNNYDAIFLVKPLGLALSVELPEPETYVAKKILGKPLLFTRDKDGNVRLFFNVCRHRLHSSDQCSPVLDP